MDNKPIQKQSDDFITLLDFWHICASHWNWFAASLLICITLATVYLIKTPNIYTRQMAVLVKQETQGKTVSSKGSYETDFKELGLVNQTTNVANVQRQFTSLNVLTEVARRTMKPANEQEARRMAERIQGSLKTSLDDDKSTIINIKYTNTSPLIAENVLCTIIEVYNEKWIEEKNEVTINTSKFIEARLKLLEKDLGNVDDSISEFKMRNKITDLNRVSDIYLEQQSKSDADILRLTSQTSMAHYILGILKDKSANHQLLPTNSGLNNQVAEAQINQYNAMLLQLKSNLVSTSAQNPLIIKQEEELAEVRSNILATISNHIKTMEIQLNAIQGYNGEANDKISSNPNQAKLLASVEREQKVKESLYLYLLQKKEENELSMTYSSVNTQMIDMPHGSNAPTSPNNRNVIFAAVLLGLVLPASILFAKINMDNTVRDKHDVEQKTNLAVIGNIPKLFEEKKRLRFPFFRKQKEKTRRLVVQHNKQDLINEAFRYIRTNLEFMTPKHGENNVYIITSSYEGSGKTFISANLAVALAIAGKHVLYIDGDLRHASASNLFYNGKSGFADYLADRESDMDKLIHHSEEYPTLDTLPVGTIPPNPTELLSGKRLPQLLELLRPLYDFILIDCPPADNLADAGIIEQYADRTLFVIRAGLFDRRRLPELEADVQNGRYKHMSVIVNDTNTGSRYGYAYHYGYYNGYHQNKD